MAYPMAYHMAYPRFCPNPNFYHGIARCSGRKFFTQLFEHFCAYLMLHYADHSDLGIIGKAFSSCRS